VAADRQGNADSLQELVTVVKRLAEAIENQNRSTNQALPPEALSPKEAARFMGVTLATVNHLIRTRKLPYAQHGDQRGRMILVKDCRKFLEDHRQAIDKKPAAKKRHA
jgi:excisionase family DNA binding protein